MGKTLGESRIREIPGSSVAAIKDDRTMSIKPDPHAPIKEHAELVLLLSYEGEQKLLQWEPVRTCEFAMRGSCPVVTSHKGSPTDARRAYPPGCTGG